MAKQDGRRLTPSAQAALRKQVVEFLRKKNGTQAQAADIFGLSIRGVEDIWRRYKQGGHRGIEEKKRGVKGGKKINNHQAGEVCKLIKEKLPDQLKLPFGLWTREAVKQLIFTRYDIDLSRWQIGRYLKSWGYTPQKPISKAFEQKPEKVRQWLSEECPSIKKRAQKEKVFYISETRPA